MATLDRSAAFVTVEGGDPAAPYRYIQGGNYFNDAGAQVSQSVLDAGTAIATARTNQALWQAAVNGDVAKNADPLNSTPTEIDTLVGLTAAETSVLDGVTAGTVLGGKAIVVNSDKHIDTLGIAIGGLKIGATGAEVALPIIPLSTAITANSTATTSAAGTLGVTSHATGRGYIFMSDGSKWQYWSASTFVNPVFKKDVTTDAWTINASGALVASSDGGADIGNGASDPRDINLTRYFISRDGRGAKNGASVSATEYGGGGVPHKTVLTLTATPVTMTDDPGNGAYAAVKLYDFPAGNIVTLGASINADLTLSETWWVDNKDGDVGLGTVATAVGTALTGTTQNIIATTATTAAAQVSSLDTQSTGVGTSGAAGGTDADITLNIRVDDDALHFPDLVTNGTFTGNSTGWTEGAGWAYGTNDEAATLADTALTQTPAAPTIVAGVSYKLVFDATRTAGSVLPSVGGTAGTARSSSATFTETIVAGADGVLAFTGTGFSGTVDNIVLTPLTGSGTVTGSVTVVWDNAGDF